MKKPIFECVKVILLPLVLLVLSAATLAAKGPSADEIMKKVQKKISSAKVVEADFVQVFEWSVAGERQEFQGKIWIGQKDAFRIETPEQLIVSDGKSVWTLDKVNRQVIVDYLNPEEETYLPRQLSLQFSRKYSAKLEGKEKIGGQELYHISLRSKDPDVFIQQFDLWIDASNYIVRKIAYLDANENRTVYEIKRVRFLQRYDPALFQYSVPEGVEVVDLRTGK